MILKFRSGNCEARMLHIESSIHVEVIQDVGGTGIEDCEQKILVNMGERLGGP